MYFLLFFVLFNTIECLDLNALITRNQLNVTDECTQNLEKYEISCLEEVNNRWEINGTINSTEFKTDRQFCCSTWDYMLCIIKKARDVCSKDDLELIIKSSIEREEELEEKTCYHYSRDSIFQCHFYWYYYIILIIGLICVFAVIVMLATYFFRQENKKPEKFEIIKVDI